MPDCCVAYTTDPTYLFPTLVSAIQARRHASPGVADIAIFSFGADLPTSRVFERACKAEGIHFQPVEPSVIDHAPAMLARLHLSRIVPRSYGQFLYIDGDTQIDGSLDPILAAPVPAGRFLAANDPMTFSYTGNTRHDRDIAEHFRAAGFLPDEFKTYFNSGVLRINRDGWDGIEAAALELHNNGNASSRFPDQDILNLAARGHCIPMSLAWNFPIFMKNARVEGTIRPRIYHYMSNPKPWQGVFPPWQSAARLPYLSVARAYPDIAAHHQAMPLRKQARYHLQQRYKRALEAFTWGMGPKRARILDYERGVTAARGPIPSIAA